jgi:hypothetical protein
MTSFKLMTQKVVKDGTSQFQNFHVNAHKFDELFLYSLSVAFLSGGRAANSASRFTRQRFLTVGLDEGSSRL